MATTGKIIDGKAIAAEVREHIKQGIDEVRRQHPEFTPGLAIVQAGDRADSNVYIRNKLTAAQNCGIKAIHVKLPSTVNQAELVEVIDKLNRDPTIDGMIVQLPLETDRPIDADTVINGILPEKDVDGLSRENGGRLARGELDGTLIPCTPRGCLHLVKSTGIDVKGKNVVVIGRSKIVGMPASELFLWNHATVTTCHSRTVNLPEVCRRADILVVAIGKAEFVKADWVKPGAIVIDCGINVGPPNASGKSPLLGDVDFAGVSQVASHITPVPGGVGPMTIAMLLQNTFEQAKKRLQVLSDR